MASKDSQSQPSQSYLAKLSPWTRSPALQPIKGKDGEPEHAPLVKQRQGADHVISQRHRLSLRKYPRDCPPLRPQWFHAVDSPKRRPNPAGDKVEKALPRPKKYAAFSVRDSKRIEGAYGKLAEGEQAKRQRGEIEQEDGDISTQSRDHGKQKAGLEDNEPGQVRVPVNEDYLFDVDVERRELGPAYWLGPVYDVRRGTWFYQEGATQRPCDENLAEQLEDGYIKVQPWRFPPPGSSATRSASQPRTRPTSWTPGQASERPPASAPMTPKGSNPDLRRQAVEASDELKPPSEQHKTLETGQTQQPENTYRLFGSHINTIVTYQDANTAWLLTDDFMARMNYTVYQRFAGGGHFGGIKMTRGYQPQIKKPADTKDEKIPQSEDKQTVTKSENETESKSDEAEAEEHEKERQSVSEVRRARLERHISSLTSEAIDSPEERAKQEEEIRKRDEREMEEDYRETEDDDPDREIEHLILVTHGIGQRLGLRIDAVNFVHDVNTLRKTIKAVYGDSPDLRALNAELGETQKVNSRIQVLPICWRHLLDFPKQSLRHNRSSRSESPTHEHDLGDTSLDDSDLDYPSLEDISVEGVPGVRNLITDLALDILLYQSPAYKDHISRIVLEECNRIYGLFMERNPTFKGKVSFIGHSLGSAIMFDLLCRQGKSTESGIPAHGHKKRVKHPLKLDFEVEDFYALGSPIGLFQMLKGRTVQGREAVDARHRAVSGSTEDPMLDAASQPASLSALGRARKASTAANTSLPSDIAVSSPKCAQIFNIFHPTDPISYRLEPLISPTMSSLKPQPLPYTKRGIFGAPMGQGLTGIGARVSQSVSSMWSSMASSLLTRGLGYRGNEAAALPSTTPATNPAQRDIKPAPGPAGAGLQPSIAAPEEPKAAAHIQASLAAQTVHAQQRGAHPPTLIDAEIETLYAGFQKAQTPTSDPGATATDWREAEREGKRLRREEEKVRRLNSNGRVDYAIQEGAFDINLIAAIASHLSYWSDEDVSHFLIGQLLSRGRVVRMGGELGVDGAGDAGGGKEEAQGGGQR